jgi:hypothetical protein
MLTLKVRFNYSKLRALAFYVLVIGLPFSVFAWRLSSQTSGFGPAEAATRTIAKFSNIRSDTLFLPYKLLENIMFHISHGAHYGLRLTSVIFGLVFVFAFFNLLKNWFGRPIALLATLLMALTPLYLLASRTATADISYCASILILYGYSLAKKHPGDIKFLLPLTLSLAVCLYTPGLVWVLLLTLLVWPGKIQGFIKEIPKKSLLLVGLLCLILMVPLIINFIQNPALIKQWLLIPVSFTSAMASLKSIAWMVIGLFIRLRDYSNTNLGRLPILNAVQIGLLVFGFYIMLVRLTRQLIWLSGAVIISIILAGLNNNPNLILISLPAISFMCGMGLRYLFVEWRSVFPRNPLAKSFAIGLMSAIVLIHIIYGIRYSLIAWPASESVKQSYVLK